MVFLCFKKNVLTYNDVYGILLGLLVGEKFLESFKFWDETDELRHNIHNLSKLSESWGKLYLLKRPTYSCFKLLTYMDMSLHSVNKSISMTEPD